MEFMLFVLIFVICKFKENAAQVVFGYKNYTEFELGNINILITVSHDGWMEPSSIKDRTEPSPIDENTRNFARVLRDELTSLFSAQYGYSVRPFVIYNNLHRLITI
jgi:hypothetical protein